MSDLSTLALANREALLKLSATMTEGASVFAQELADPQNSAEAALTGNHVFSLIATLTRLFGLWQQNLDTITIAQPEFQQWNAMQKEISGENPGLDD